MDFTELLEYLELDDASQFEYFEAMADLTESEDYIGDDAMYELFKGADHDMIAELLEDYFEDILEGLPEDAGEIYSLLHQVKMSLAGLIAQVEDDSDVRRFAEEYSRFRNWYSHESEVKLTPDDGGQAVFHNVRDAITASRLEKLGGEKYSYDFENALDYELDSYIMSFADLTGAVETDGDNDGTIIFSPEEGEPGDE